MLGRQPDRCAISLDSNRLSEQKWGLLLQSPFLIPSTALVTPHGEPPGRFVLAL